jgi:hypothetical protein
MGNFGMMCLDPLVSCSEPDTSSPDQERNFRAMNLTHLTNFKLLSIALAILGAIVWTLLIGWFGFNRIAGAILAVGGRGATSK